MSTERKKEWFDDESFWRDLYPFMFPDARFSAVEEQIEQVLALAAPPGNDALDLCCGPGRWSVALAQAGFAVTGVDITPHLLGMARDRAADAGVEIEYVRSDMRDFARPGSFDLALSMFTSFGYFEQPEEDIGVLRNVFLSLRPGGVFLLEMMGKERLARIFQPTTSSSLPDGTLLVERHEVRDAWSRMANEWTLIRDGKARTFRFEHTIYSARELRDRLEQAGFGEVNAFGGFDGAPYGPESERLVVVARKAL